MGKFRAHIMPRCKTINKQIEQSVAVISALILPGRLTTGVSMRLPFR
tara:strand:+ start:7079 stop:7219 length:141 start_codon:yes stop_codon:yes gene_type:complete